ncbi:MAG TPA: flavocytochrome c [Firmicutes bacterium]|nr:flavocytochrome c [Bacillota bacterium]
MAAKGKLTWLVALLICLAVAGLSFAGCARPQPAPPKATEGPATEKYDVVVVGAGLAGLSGAIAAAENGAKVALLERMPYVGGNSILSTGALYVGATSIQAAAGIKDSPDDFYKEAMAKSKDRRDPVQTRLVADLGGETVDWLIAQGVKFSDKVTPVMGSPTPRAHQALPNAAGLISALKDSAEKKGVKIFMETRATKLIMSADGKVAGLEATDKSGKSIKFETPAVILATGGFGANPELLKKYIPDMANAIYAGHPGTTGDGLLMALEVGADTVDINEPWWTPTIEVNKKQLITSLVLSKGAILVNSKGQRFTDETASYAETAAAVLKTGEPFVYEVFDANVSEAVYKVPEYKEKGMVVEANTIEELAQKMGVDAKALKATINEYNKAVATQKDKFGRKIFGKKLERAPFAFIKVKPGTIMTPGGLRIDGETRVIKKDKSPISGLYAAGEVTGGYRAFGYIGGDSLAHCAVTGMVAGQKAAAYAKQK